MNRLSLQLVKKVKEDGFFIGYYRSRFNYNVDYYNAAKSIPFLIIENYLMFTI